MNFHELMCPPDFSAICVLTIEALAPLSMVPQMPGKYYRSQREPSSEMLYGLLENALGWHLGESDRNLILRRLKKQHNLPQEITESGVGFKSLLQFHVRFGVGIKETAETMWRYDDYWSQHLRTGGLEFFGGSREHDAALISLVNAAADKTQNVSLTDSGGLRDANIIHEFQPGDKINLAVVRPYFPRYYISPTPREYVVPRFAYRYRVETSSALALILAEAITDPVAPLYLGSNDGWIEANWQMIKEAVQ